MPDYVAAPCSAETLLANLFSKHNVKNSTTTSSRTLEWATSCLAAWLSTGGSTTSPEVRVLLEVMEEEVRWLKRRNDEADRRAANPLRVSKRLTVQAAPPAQLPTALYKAMKRVGFSYDTSTQTWSAWDSEEAQVIFDSLQEQGRLW